NKTGRILRSREHQTASAPFEKEDRYANHSAPESWLSGSYPANPVACSVRTFPCGQRIGAESDRCHRNERGRPDECAGHLGLKETPEVGGRRGGYLCDYARGHPPLGCH